MAVDWSANNKQDASHGEQQSSGNGTLHRFLFDDALKHVLSVGPMPKAEKSKPRKKKTARKKR